MPAAEFDDVVVGDVEVGVGVIAAALLVVDRVEGEHDGGVEAVGFEDRLRELGLDAVPGRFIFAANAQTTAMKRKGMLRVDGGGDISPRRA